MSGADLVPRWGAAMAAAGASCYRPTAEECRERCFEITLEISIERLDSGRFAAKCLCLPIYEFTRIIIRSQTRRLRRDPAGIYNSRSTAESM